MISCVRVVFFLVESELGVGQWWLQLRWRILEFGRFGAFVNEVIIIIVIRAEMKFWEKKERKERNEIKLVGFFFCVWLQV